MAAVHLPAFPAHGLSPASHPGPGLPAVWAVPVVVREPVFTRLRAGPYPLDPVHVLTSCKGFDAPLTRSSGRTRPRGTSPPAVLASAGVIAWRSRLASSTCYRHESRSRDPDAR